MVGLLRRLFVIAATTALVVADNDDSMGMVACDTTRRTQDWSLSDGISPGTSTMTHIKDRYGDCIEVTGCQWPNAHVGTGYGCKDVPQTWGCTTGRKNICDCNMAWAINSNGTISAVQPGVPGDAGPGAMTCAPWWMCARARGRD